MTVKPKILVLGGGFAALESAFLLRMRLHDAVDIRLVSASDQFTFRRTVYVPFGADPARCSSIYTSRCVAAMSTSSRATRPTSMPTRVGHA